MKGFGAQRKDFAPPAGAERARQDDLTALALDVPAQVREGSAEADVVVDENVGPPGEHGPGEERLERQPMEAARPRVADGVGLDDLARHREPQTLAQLVRHGVGDQVDPGGLDGADWNDDRLPIAENIADPGDGGPSLGGG